jgi:tRNA (mo5U34)-methyltransferase
LGPRNRRPDAAWDNRRVGDLDLRAEIIRLGPWHLDVQVTPELSTRVSLEAPVDSYDESFGTVPFQSGEEGFKHKLRTLYPGGLEGRSVLDCACNCGAYLFWAKELGAGRCFGSDVREHWIRQARFLLERRPEPKDDIRFEVCDLYDLPKLSLEPFDVTIFTGLFYHLPDPMTGLKIAADLTNELLIFDSATLSDAEDGFLAVEEERREPLMSGVYGLRWLPTGPKVLTRVFQWAGFVEFRVVRWVKKAKRGGRVGMLASKVPGLLDDALGEPISPR